MQHWCNGSTSAFQTDSAGSTPVCCSSRTGVAVRQRAVRRLWKTSEKKSVPGAAIAGRERTAKAVKQTSIGGADE